MTFTSGSRNFIRHGVRLGSVSDQNFTQKYVVPTTISGGEQLWAEFSNESIWKKFD
jgi:hypothetical protein